MIFKVEEFLVTAELGMRGQVHWEKIKTIGAEEAKNVAFSNRNEIYITA